MVSAHILRPPKTALPVNLALGYEGNIMSNESEFQIVDAEKRLQEAMLSSNIADLNELLSSSLVFTNHLGQVLNKEADIQAHKSGTLKISILEPSEQKILFVSATVAVVSVRVQLNGTYAGQPAGGNFRFTRVWSFSPDNNWQVVAAHACIIV